MEPVPETERMEAFRSSPVPSLRLGTPIASRLEIVVDQKPGNPRRSSEPSPTSPRTPSAWAQMSSLPYRPRTASPLSHGHTRSRSAASIAPPMSRTQSLPGLNGSGHILIPQLRRPESPSPASPSRIRVPRKPLDESFPPPSPVRSSVIDPERRHRDRSSSPGLGFQLGNNGRIQRPSSPLRSYGNLSSGSLSQLPSTPSSVASSPSYRAYDSFSGSLSSVPSTPTSTRSRSPSISSLETIPDTPDAEEAALEAERIAQLKAAADAADSNESDSKGRSSLDVPSRGRTMTFGSRDKRKRWSVCGAERRGDLDLETIWED